MGWAFIFEFYPERKREVKSKNIKAQPICKFAKLYACKAQKFKIIENTRLKGSSAPVVHIYFISIHPEYIVTK
jgi:hypothetical protein